MAVCLRREVKTHGGFFCVNARDCRVRGGKAPAGLGGGGWATPGRGDRTQDILNALRSPGPGTRVPGVLSSPQAGSANQMVHTLNPEANKSPIKYI